MYVLILSTACLKYFSFKEVSEIWLQLYTGLHVKYPLFLSEFSFLDRFYKNTQISDLMKIRPMGAELLPADGQTWPKLIFASHNSANGH